MRVRGTNITDIVILVVDAVEGPLEQTLESLRAIRKSQCNMIVVRFGKYLWKESSLGDTNIYWGVTEIPIHVY